MGSRSANMSLVNRLAEYDEFVERDFWFSLEYWSNESGYQKKAFPKTCSKMIENITIGLSALSNTSLSCAHVFEFIEEKGIHNALKTRQR